MSRTKKKNPCENVTFAFECDDISCPQHAEELKNQSPINIDSAKVKMLESYPLTWSSGYFKTPKAITVKNIGETLKLTVQQNDPLTVTSRKLYFCPFTFEYITFHWGYKNKNGAEHQINGHVYPIEMQVVHSQNTKAYHPKFLIISYFFYLHNMYHWGLKNILKMTTEIAKNKNINIKLDPFPLKELVYTPSFSYYTYDGSFTSIPYEECVKWIICEKPLPICQNQLKLFKKMCKIDKQFRNNFRTSQDVNYRLIEYVKNE